ncbi:alpha-galactosidase [Quadrisphaera granulorum]|uniref:alpha-galactosidase n=1 Tax=Quadrisphaera granulorum TaxID=317664 RepID=A0A316AB77_9ACTN|nr:alpha-galactosidase [Quadrisphaera granulorum]PWJ54679.1 alpha-galactosidase [Quadrisphaera granulorum]SZE96041.1 alpha-galactosidase [Quadrisphaera granulorum]
MPSHPSAVLLTRPDAGCEAAALALAVPSDGSLPRIVWWGPASQVAGASAADVVAVRRGLLGVQGLAVLPEHSTGRYSRPALRGHRPQPVTTQTTTTQIGGEDPAWSTAFRLVSVEADLDLDGPEDRLDEPEDRDDDARRAGGAAAAGAAVTAPRVVVVATDPVAGLGLRTELEALPGGLLRARHTLTNRSSTSSYALEGLEVLVPLPDEAAEVLDHTGGWLHERVPQRAPVRDGLWLRENRTGKTGHDAAGDVVVGVPGFSFDAGEVRSAAVGWSGNTVQRLERSPSTQTTLGGGELLLQGETTLAPGESYTTPWLYLGASTRGLDGLAAANHAFLRAAGSATGAAPKRPVPVTLNVWEAVWFDHDLPHLLHLAELAASIGVERFVLDDGWFGARRDDTAGLGDWVVSEDAWPASQGGLAALADAVHGFGMQFGLWFEPEMVNPDSDIFRAHPDWVLSARGTTPALERDQLVLDLSRDEVREYVRDAVSAVLSTVEVDYVKWDHNRDLLEAGGAAAGPGVGGRPVVSAHTAGFYRLLDELRALHPGVEWESCASGGGRVDVEVLQHVQRVWTSDMTDAVARQDIQRWMVQQAPPEYLGAHVSAPVSHQTHRSIPLDFRAATALFGAFGIEWDVSTASEADRERLAEWVAVFKEHRGLLHSGRTWRADSPDPAVRSHGVVALDGSQALVAQVQLAESWVEHPVPVRLPVAWNPGDPGLEPGLRYRARWVGPVPQADRGARANLALGWRAGDVDAAGPLGEAALPGAVLGSVGLVLPRRFPLSVTLVHLQAV